MDAAQKYSLYLQSHIENVAKAYTLLLPFALQIGLSESDLQQLKENIKNHDKSKFLEDEFVPYSNYFYGEKTDETIKNFKAAVKLHKERNPHHHEFWRGGERYP